MIAFAKRSIRSYQGRHFTSRWARKLFDTNSGRVRIGYTIALFVMFTVLFEPASKVLASEIVTPTIPPNEVVNAADITTEHTVVWPVKSPSITQGYRLGHYGVDIQDKANLSIYPVDDGVITGIEDSRFGYGKHVYIDHGDGRSSLYAHLSSINVVVGQQVNRDTIIGIMGKTGWASGIHLHLEIYQNGKALNPVTLLPTLSQTIASVQK